MRSRLSSFRLATLLCVSLLGTAGLRPVVAHVCAAMGMLEMMAAHACCDGHCDHMPDASTSDAPTAPAPYGIAMCCTATPATEPNADTAVAAPEAPRTAGDVLIALLPEAVTRDQGLQNRYTLADTGPPPVRLHLAHSLLLI